MWQWLGYFTHLCILSSMLLQVQAEDMYFPIGVIGPITSLSQDFLAAAVAVDIDFRKNFNASLRERFGEPIVKIANLHSDLRISLQLGTSNSDPNVGMNTALDWLLGSDGASPVLAIVGGYHSAVTVPISTITSVRRVPTVAWGATSPALSDKASHPYFLRTIPPDSFQGAAMWAWMGHFEVPSVALLYTTEPYGEGLFLIVSVLAHEAGQIHRVLGTALPYQPADFDLQLGRKTARSVRDSGSKFLIMAMGGKEANSMMYVMEQDGVLSSYQVLAAEGITLLPSNPYAPVQGLPTGFMQFLPVTQGPLFPKLLELVESLTVEDLYGEEAQRRYFLDQMAVPLDAGASPMLTAEDLANAALMDVLAPYVFDAVFSVIVAINALLHQGRQACDIKGETLLAELQRTTFEGVSGVVEFDAAGDRSGHLNMHNLQPLAPGGSNNSRRLVVVATFNGSTSLLTSLSDPLWARGGHSPRAPSELLECPSNFQVDPNTKICSLCPKGIGCGFRPEEGFPLGFLGPITSVDQGFLAAAIAFDIDFRKNFDASLRERFGDPIVRIENVHPDLRMKLQIGTSNSEVAVGLNTVLDWFLGARNYSHVAGIVGGYHSAVSSPISSSASVFQIPQVSWASTSPTLSDKAAHPYFMRTVPPDSLAAHGMWLWMTHFGVPSVIFLHSKEAYGEGYFQSLRAIAVANGNSARVVGVGLDYDPNDFDVEDARRTCDSIRALGSKVIMMALASRSQFTSMMYVMEQAGLLLLYQFMGTDTSLPVDNNPLRPSFKGMPPGFMRLVPVTQGQLFPRFLQMWQMLTPEDIYGREARERYQLSKLAVPFEGAATAVLTPTDFSDADGSAMEYYATLFDAGYSFVVAINSLLNKGYPPTEIMGEVLLNEIRNTSFEGVSGAVQFDVSGDRLADYLLLNWGLAEEEQERVAQLAEEMSVAVLRPESGEIRMLRGQSVYWVGGILSDTLPLALLSCDEGFEFDSGLGYCTPCPNGWFSEGGHRVSCQPCPPGFTSSTPTAASACTACGNGTFSAVVGNDCAACPLGMFGASEGQSACQPCSVGSYANATGQAHCTRCGAGLRSESLWTSLSEVQVNEVTEYIYAEGSVSQEACGCDRGARRRGSECIPCTEGMVCSGMSQIEIEAGYFADHDLSEVYRCHGDGARCVGGPPGLTCATGRMGLACAECKEGWKPKAGSRGVCEQCADEDAGPLIGAALLAVLCLVIIYHLISDVQDQVTQSHSGLLIVICVGLLVTMAQQIGVISSLPIHWREPLASPLRHLGLLAFDLTALRLGCVIAVGAVTRFCVKVSMIFFTIVVMLLVHICFVLLCHGGRFKERRGALISSVGTLFTLFYISVTSTVLEPLQCQEHPAPNHKWTTTNYPGILCWESQEHLVMLAVGGFAFLAVPVAYLAACIMVVRQVPMRVQRADAAFLKTVSFLFFRFNPEKHHYAIVQMLRSFFFSLVLVIPDVALQVVFLEIILLAGLVLSLSQRPWRVAYANGFDCMGGVSMMIFVCIASLFISEEDKELDRLSMVCLVTLASTPIPLSFAIWQRALHILRRLKPFEFFLCHHKAGAGAFARLLKMCLKDSQRLQADVFLDSDNLHNLGDLFDQVSHHTSCLLILATDRIFTRPWCVGEMCTARLRMIRTVVLWMSHSPARSATSLPYHNTASTCSFASAAAALDLRVQQIEQIDVLIENGLDLARIKSTLQWVLDMPPLFMPSKLSSKVLSDLVHMLLLGKSLQLPCSLESSEAEHLASDVSSVLVFENEKPEAAAAALVLQRMLATSLAATPTKIPALLEHLTGSLPASLDAVIFICTGGCFESGSCLSMVVEISRLEHPPVTLPVIAEATFQIPTRERMYVWMQQDAALSTSLGGGTFPTEVSNKLAHVLLLMFNEIALVFEPNQDADAILIIRAAAILQRLISMGALAHGSQPLSGGSWEARVEENLHRSSKTTSTNATVQPASFDDQFFGPLTEIEC